MSTTSVLVLFSLIVCVLSHPLSAHSPATEGESCTPAIYIDCGEAELVNQSATPAGIEFGPNVCKFENIYTISTISYEWKKYCKGLRFKHCYLTCETTNQCNSSRTFIKKHVGCCDGFTGDATATDKEYFSKYKGCPGTPTKKTLKTEGCPRETQPTVWDCLETLGLASSDDLFWASELGAVLASEDSQITLFAPSGELSQSLLSSERLERVLGTHLVDGIIPAAFLDDGQQLETFSDGLSLHISEVYLNKSKAIFVNGKKLTVRDACVADNGIVHVIDDFILAEEQTLSEVLEDTEELSIFNFLIKEVGPDELLNGTKLLTVFAPTDDALVELDIDCLLSEENKKALKKFLLYHISKGAEYSASLALRDDVITNHCYKVKYHHFCPSYYTKCNKLEIQLENDVILVGDDGAEVTQADIPASNGVIHFLSEPLFLSKSDLEELCHVNSTSIPTTASPSTSSPTTAIPSTSTRVTETLTREPETSTRETETLTRETETPTRETETPTIPEGGEIV